MTISEKPVNYDLDYLNELEGLLKPVKEASYRYFNKSEVLQILDVGCGRGEDCRKISKLVSPESLIYGLDRDQYFIDTAREQTQNSLYKNIKYLDGKASDLPFENQSLNIVRYERVFQHLMQPEQSFSEAWRVLKKEGQILILETDWLTCSFGTSSIQSEQNLIAEKCMNDLNNGMASRKIVEYLKIVKGKYDIEVQCHVTMVDSLKLADYIFGIRRNIKRMNDLGMNSFLKELQKLDQHDTFSFSWNTIFYKILKK